MTLTNFEKQYIAPSTFYFARVEDTKDPNKMGRYRIRIYGIDSFDMEKKLVKTEHLPWARSINNFGLHKEVGFMKQYRINDIVVCTLLNNNRDTPLILGCIEAPDDFGKHDFKGITIRNDEKITLESIEPLKEEKPGDDDKEDKEEEEKKEDPKIATMEQTITSITHKVIEGDKKTSVMTQTIPNISQKVTEGDDKSSELVQTVSDIKMKFKGNKETTLTFKGDGKFSIKNDQGELIAILVDLVDAITKEKHIGNMGAPTQMDPVSLQTFMQLKQKLSSFKV